MESGNTQTIRLTQLPLGVDAQICAIHGGRNMTRRLLSLGLRVGSRIRVSQQRGKGVVVACQGNRVALGGGVAERIMMQLVDQQTSTQVSASR